MPPSPIEPSGRRRRRAAAPAAPDGGTVLEYYGIPLASERIVFVLDLSESMNRPARMGDRGGRTRLDLAREELAKAIGGLDPRARFDVLFFNRGRIPWKRDLQPATPENRTAAIEFAERSLTAPGTAIYDALEMALGLEGADTVFLLTDGEPVGGRFVEEWDILREIARLDRTRRIRIHTIGVAKPAPLLRRLAEESGGTYVRP